MKIRTRFVGIASGLTMLLSAPAAAQVVNFDGMPANACNAVVNNGYAGFNWANWGICDQATGTPGAIAGISSGSNGAFNFNGGLASIHRASPFGFLRLHLNTAWLTDLHITVVGKLGGSTLFTRLIDDHDISNGMLYNFGWWVDELVFTSVAGPDATAPFGRPTGTEFVIDDFTYTNTPEPSTVVLLATGLFGMGLYHRRRWRDLEG